MRRALLVLVPVTLVACHPWDDALNQRLAELDAGAAADAGDHDAGQQPPDAGMDAGLDAGRDGGVDAGCPDAYCVFDAWQSGSGVNGVVMSSLTDMTVAGDIGNDAFTARTVAQPLADGGHWRWVNTPVGVISPVSMVGVSPNDVWLWHTSQLVHQEGNDITDQLDSTIGCGFDANFWHDAVAVSVDEAWFAGPKFAVCRWRRDAGFEPITPTANFDTADRDLTAIGLEPDGQVLLAEYGGGFYRLDGGVAFPPLPATFGSPQAMRWSPSGALWVLGSTEGVARHRPDGGWLVNTVASSGTNLYALAVRADDDVWVGGDFTLRHFDGTSFENLLLNGFPGLPSTPSIYSIGTTGPDNLVITGFGSLDPNPGYGFVTRYTRH